MASGNTVNDFKPGDSVVYIPTHLQYKDISSKDLAFGFLKANPTPGGVELGVVKVVTENTVFVNYVINGIVKETAQGTSPCDLWHN